MELIFPFPSEVNVDFVKAMRYEDERSKRNYYSVIILDILLVVIAIITLFTYCTLITMILGALTIINRVISFLVREQQTIHTHIAKRLRRMAILKDGIGIEPESSELMQLEAQIGAMNGCKLSSNQYYTSAFPDGEKRLADITAESAFFTGNHARKLAIMSTYLCIAGLIIVGILIYSFLNIGVPFHIQSVFAKAFITVAIFFAIGDFADFSRKYKRLANSCEKIHKRGISLCSKIDIQLYEARPLLEEYICIVSNAPPIPKFIYELMKDELNRIWQEHRGCNKQESSTSTTTKTDVSDIKDNK